MGIKKAGAFNSRPRLVAIYMVVSDSCYRLEGILPLLL